MPDTVVIRVRFADSKLFHAAIELICEIVLT